MPALTASSLALTTSSRARQFWRQEWSWASSWALTLRSGGRVVIGVAEVLRVWEFQDEPDTADVHGEHEGVQVALGGVGEAVGAVAVGGFQISTCAALGYNASETAT